MILAFPAIVAVIAIVAFWGQSLFKITVIFGVATIPVLYRVVRASTLAFANRDFVIAARTLGASTRRILFREILPNVAPVALTFGLINVAVIIVLEGSLAFLGLSVALPTPSWGNIISEGRRTTCPDQPLHHDVAGPRHVPAPPVHQPHR